MLKYVFCLLVLLNLAFGCGNEGEPVKAERTADARPWKLICLGDNWTIGTGLEPEFAYPALLAGELAKTTAVKIVNAGMKNETVSSAANRIDWILQQRTDAFLLAYGQTDESLSVSGETQLEAWQKLLTKLRNAYPDLPVLILYTGTDQAVRQKLEASLGAYKPHWVATNLPKATKAPQYWDDDGKNLSKAGQQLLTTQLLPLLSASGIDQTEQ